MLHPEDAPGSPFPVFWPPSWPHPDRLYERLPVWLDRTEIVAAGEILGEAGLDCDPIAFAQMAALSYHLTPAQVARCVIGLTELGDLGSVA